MLTERRDQLDRIVGLDICMSIDLDRTCELHHRIAGSRP